MFLIRWLLGRIILGLDFIFSPKSANYTPEIQTQLDQTTQSWSLYQFAACPFCVKVRREIKRNGLKIELRDAKDNSEHRQELLKGGGRVKVPCLRIDGENGITWMYESNDIIEFMQKTVSEINA